MESIVTFLSHYHSEVFIVVSGLILRAIERSKMKREAKKEVRELIDDIKRVSK